MNKYTGYRMLKIIDSHTAGNPTRHIVAGVPKIPGKTMAEKMQYCKEHLDWVRKASMMEPRGNSAFGGVIYTAPCNEEADMGVIYFDAGSYMTMCGNGTMAVVTVIVETGMVPMQEPVTVVKLDTPSGLVVCEANVENGHVTKVTFQNVPCFFYDEKEIDIEGIDHKVKVAISYGGNPYAIVAAKDLGVTVSPNHTRELLDVAVRVKKAAAEQIGFQHPTQPFIHEISGVEIHQDPQVPGANFKEVAIFPPLVEGCQITLDRSPCGTGTSARIAMEYAKGNLRMHEKFVHESIIGTLFEGEVIKETMVGPYKAVIPQISGSAYLIASGDMIFDPRDPIQEGFVMQ